jgi:ribosomal protein S18 acetylase RimI-like enzyme
MDDYFVKNFNLEKLEQELSNPDSDFYFAELGREPIGYLKTNSGLAQTESLLEEALEIERIYVLSKHQGQKIGKLLFDMAIQVARKHTLERVWLGVWEKNSQALNFYQRLGFEKFDTHVFMLGVDAQTDWLMKLELNAN